MYKALSPGMIGIQMGIIDSIALAARTGYAGIPLNPDEILAVGADRVSDALLEHGVVNAGLGMDAAILSAEGSSRQEEIMRLAVRAKAARQTGCVRCNTWILSSASLPYDEEFDRLTEALRPCAHVLADEGLTLALEFVGSGDVYRRGRYPFIRTMAEMLRLCAAVDGNCNLLLDAYHLYTSGGEMDDVLRLRARDVGFVHINDALPGLARDDLPDGDRLLPGESGVIDCGRFLRNLRRIGYEGPVVAEPFYRPFRDISDPDEKAARLSAAIDRVWSV